MNENERPKISKKTLIGIVLYAVAFFAILFISNIEEVRGWIAVINAILSPIITGLVIAYLANPFFKFFERRLLLHVRPFQIRRLLSLILTYLLLLLLIGGLLLLIVPQLISSIQSFSQNFDQNLESGLQQINNLITALNRSLPVKEDGTALIPTLNTALVKSGLASAWAFLKQFVQDHLRPENIGTITTIISKTGGMLTNVLLGIFISIYLLASKEKRYAQIMKFRRAYFGDTLNHRITNFCTIADNSFGGFLRGKLLDSTIVGLLVYITCLIFGVPYPVLVAVIIGITDIVPVIGPFIGVIPTAIIILLTEPIKVIIFLIAILIIQQIDGNIIAPKILGENTGVSSLCVMIAILIMGDLLGLLGMIIGVPLFATVIELVKIFLDNRLRAKGRTEDRPPTEEIRERAEACAEETRGVAASTALILSEGEQAKLRAYALAKKHRILENASQDTVDAFAKECADMSENQQVSENPVVSQNGEESNREGGANTQ